MADNDNDVIPLRFLKSEDLLANPKGFASYPDNVINLSDVMQNAVPKKIVDGSLFDSMIIEPLLALSKHENILKDLGNKLDNTAQTINNFADAAFHSDTFKRATDNISKASDIFGKNIDTIAKLVENLILFKEAMQRVEFKGFDPEKLLRNLVVAPDINKTELPQVLEFRRNPKIHEKLFIAELLKNKTAIFWKAELYARSRLWEANKPKDGGRVDINKLTVLLSNNEFLQLQGIFPKYGSNKARKKDQLYNNLQKLDEACGQANDFPMFRSLLEVKDGILVVFHQIYIAEYFSKGNTTLHFSAKWLFQLNDIVKLKVAQKLLDHASTSKNRLNKRHTTLSFESIFNAVYVDSGLSIPRDINLAKNRIARLIHEALREFDALGHIELDGWKIGKDKGLVDDEDIAFNYRNAIDREYKVVFRIPDIETYMKDRDKKRNEQNPNKPLN